MRILFLSSNIPSLDHSNAGAVDTVMGCLIAEIRKSGHQVSWMRMSEDRLYSSDQEKIDFFEKLGVNLIGDYSDHIVKHSSSISKKINAMKSAFFVLKNGNLINIKKANKIVHDIQKTNSDAIILFWDTHFELVINKIKRSLKDTPVFAYWARPRHASAKIRLKTDINTHSKIKRSLLLKSVRNDEKAHLRRAEKLNGISNICLCDVHYYENEGIPCEYITNTWPDNFKENWEILRKKAEKKNNVYKIFVNMGNLQATGNYYGLSFFADKILYLFEKKYQGENYCFNICGPGELPDQLKEKLKHQKVKFKGFVPDIDSEMLMNKLFLMFNNTGPYIGCYTRIIYAFSSGACIIGHTKLGEIMPEVRHGYNALLANTPEDIVQNIIKVMGDNNLRLKISKNARLTYEKRFHPAKVAKKIISLIENPLLF